MPQFQYQILVGRDDPAHPGTVIWFLTNAQNTQQVGPNLPVILNQLGNQGWDIAGIGDVGLTPRSEIILKKTVE